MRTTILGLVMAILGRGPEAIEQWQTTLRLAPNFAEAHSNLGTALNNLGRPEEAVTHYQQAIKLRPQLYSAQENLAATLAKLGRSEEAIAVAERAIDFEIAQHEPERAERMKAWLANYRAGLKWAESPWRKINRRRMASLRNLQRRAIDRAFAYALPLR